MILARGNGSVSNSCLAFSHGNHPLCDRLLSHLIQVVWTLYWKRCRDSMLWVIP